MRTKLWGLAIILTALIQNSYAQAISGQLENYLNSWLEDIPGSSGDDFYQPNSTQLSTWNQTIEALLNDNISTAQTMANTIHYKITEYIDTVDLPGQLYYILEEQSPATYHWGIFVFNSNACRKDLIIQAPHPKYDMNTGKQAIYCFTKLNARSLFISGTHRCNHSSASSCDGTTTACSSTSSPYRISDMAHNINTAFQNTTELLFQEKSDAVFVQLHGFSKQSTDPYIIMSNGSRYTPAHDYAAQLKNELFLADSNLTFKLAHIDLSWNRLIGFTNTQGRYVNGSSDPCNEAANSSNGNFIHIEQEKSKLRQDSNGWEKMRMALSRVFECDTLTNIPKKNLKPNSIITYPNPVSQNELTIKSDHYIDKLLLLDITGKIMTSHDYNKTKLIRLDLSNFHTGIYFLVLNNREHQYIKKLVIE